MISDFFLMVLTCPSIYSVHRCNIWVVCLLYTRRLFMSLALACSVSSALISHCSLLCTYIEKCGTGQGSIMGVWPVVSPPPFLFFTLEKIFSLCLWTEAYLIQMLIKECIKHIPVAFVHSFIHNQHEICPNRSPARNGCHCKPLSSGHHWVDSFNVWHIIL